ncbi:hypothetical protein HHK36_000568 [Tetracentron sinense]|uniref:Uncharacterized protein n=1 Tax=Tetracentron sinense TaxID=13715 RepID=A0A834ZRT0_TETSI|nr:hypothetical protein HHK36_000568 [Tetracentron sinense]
MESESPPRNICCFCYSSKRVTRKRGKSDGVAEIDANDRDWGQNDEILSDMSTFSVKEQQQRLKKALKEEEKISREAEKVVEWVKQESARMDVSAIQDMISDERKAK